MPSSPSPIPLVVTCVTSTTVRPSKEQPTDCLPPEWSRAEPFEKLAESYAVIDAMGGKVFTLRLNAEVRERILRSKDPGSAMSRRIHKEFKRRMLHISPFSFVLEVTPDDRNELHLHGAMVLGNTPLREIKDLLRAAGGRITGLSGSRQVQIKSFDHGRGGPAGWANYAKKHASRTRRAIDHHRLTYICSSLRRQCRSSWDQRRTRHCAD